MILRRFLILFAIIGFTAGCSTKKNTALRRGFHNMTAHYNVYFNGNESLKKGVQKILDGAKDNYAAILPVFKDDDEAMSRSVSSEMEKGITKSVKLIKQHSITAKPQRRDSKWWLFTKAQKKKDKEFYKRKEFCDWVDDAYLLMGRCHYYKMDFDGALKSLDIVLRDFPNDGLKPEALLWSARCNNRLKKYAETKRFLGMLELEKNLTAKMNIHRNLIYADYCIKQNRYEEALKTLQSTVKLIRSKSGRSRYLYIMAQLCQKLGKSSDAYRYFTEVTESNAPYEMSFNAKISMAVAFSGSDPSSVEGKLLKMAKDDKNVEYYDQIYYALGKVAQNAKKTDKAEEYYKKSVSFSSSNETQTAMAMLALAEIYFGKANYPLSKCYYDSTMQHLPSSYEEYQKVNLKFQNLTALIENLEVVRTEDSLRRVASMNEKDRTAYIEKIIDDLDKREKAEKSRQLAEKVNNQRVYNYGQDDIRMGGSENQGGTGKWYFYNPTSISLGQSEFIRKWGKRRLEDNWRRKSKAIVIENVLEASNANTSTDTTGGKMDKKKKEYYLKNLPMTDSLMRRSKARADQSFLNVGDIYSDKIQDYKQATKTLEALCDRKPSDEILLAAYVSLYHLSESTGNAAEAARYKKLIMEKFPNSKDAKMIGDPNYLAQIKESQRAVKTAYDQAYFQFKSQDYEGAASSIRSAKQSFANNPIEDKFNYLYIKVLANLGRKDEYKFALADFIAKHPESELKKYVIELQAGLKQAEEKKKYEETEIYFDNDKSDHFFVFLPKDKKTDFAALKFELTKFNTDKYLQNNLVISQQDVNQSQSLVVKSLENKQMAILYLNTLRNTWAYVKGLKPEEFSMFVISADNYSTLLKDKNIEKYLKYFANSYK